LGERQIPPHFALLYKPEAIPGGHSTTSSLGEICRLGPKAAWRFSPPWSMPTRLAARPWSGSWLSTPTRIPRRLVRAPPGRDRLAKRFQGRSEPRALIRRLITIRQYCTWLRFGALQQAVDGSGGDIPCQQLLRPVLKSSSSPTIGKRNHFLTAYGRRWCSA
jgi:hypothetical protein